MQDLVEKVRLLDRLERMERKVDELERERRVMVVPYYVPVYLPPALAPWQPYYDPFKPHFIWGDSTGCTTVTNVGGQYTWT